MPHPHGVRRFFLIASLLCASMQSPLAQTRAPRSGPPPAEERQAAQQLSEPSASARDLFSRYKDRLLQVRVLLASASEQSSLGSGFVVRDEGTRGALVLTNYHVVSTLAMEPTKYRIELRGTNERTVKAQLIAVDVVHDLAVLRTEARGDNTPWTSFELRDQPLPQGNKVYSLGNPLELGFLISEGIYNGQVESRIYEQMLFSGALNSGMSGGPAIDGAGRVVGVNVATRRDGTLLSFLVPVRYARELLQRASQAQPRSTWHEEITRQLSTHQAFVTDKLLDKGRGPTAPGPAPGNDPPQAGFASQTLAGRTVPTLDGSMTKCWAHGLTGEKQKYQKDGLNCRLHSDLYINSNLYTGSLSLQHVVLRNDKLPTVKFLKIAPGMHAGNGKYGNDHISRPQCQDSYVQGAQHVYRISICVRAYRKLKGLYDYNLQALQVDDAQERLGSNLRMTGFSFDNAQQIATRFLERLQ